MTFTLGQQVILLLCISGELATHSVDGHGVRPMRAVVVELTTGRVHIRTQPERRWGHVASVLPEQLYDAAAWAEEEVQYRQG